MRRKPQEIDFEEEAALERRRLEALVGQEVPLSLRYCLGPRPRVIAIDGDLALLQFPNGARLERVPLRTWGMIVGRTFDPLFQSLDLRQYHAEKAFSKGEEGLAGNY